MKNDNYFEIVSDSMAPLIEVGDMVFIKSVKKSKLKKGNLVLFKDNKKRVLHRIIELSGENIFLKGDNAFEIQKINNSEINGIASKIFSEDKKINSGDLREKLFIFLDKIFFQRIIFLRLFRYRVFRYNNMKRIKKWLW